MNRFFTLLLAASCLTAVGQYQVGDVGPAGGWIFYVDSLDEFDWDYLEVAPQATFASLWGGFTPDDSHDESLAVGSGQQNCSKILGALGYSGVGNFQTGTPAATIQAHSYISSNGIGG